MTRVRAQGVAGGLAAGGDGWWWQKIASLQGRPFRSGWSSRPGKPRRQFPLLEIPSQN